MRFLLTTTLIALVVVGNGYCQTTFNFNNLNDLAGWHKEFHGIAGSQIKISSNRSLSEPGSVKFLMKPYKNSSTDKSVRSEIHHNTGRHNYGKEYWYRINHYIPSSWVFEECLKNHDVITQWHNLNGLNSSCDKKGPPNLAIKIGGKEGTDEIGNRWYLALNAEAEHTCDDRLKENKLDTAFYLSKVERGTWTEWVVHVKWSANQDGFLEVWKDRKQVVDYDGPTCYRNLGVYLKMGVYKSSWYENINSSEEELLRKGKCKSNVDQRVLYIDDVKIIEGAAELHELFTYDCNGAGECTSDVDISSFTNDEKARNIQSSAKVYKHQTVEYTAHKSILLKDGFHAINGSRFRAKIEACPYDCYSENAEMSSARKANYLLDQLVTIEQRQINNMILFPNPSNEYVKVRITTTNPKKQIKVNLHNVRGELLEEFTYDGESQIDFNVDLRNYTNGVYFISAQFGNKSESQKLLVLR